MISKKQDSYKAYIVEKILNNTIKDTLKYLIKWEGWAYNDNTWELLDNLINVMNLVENLESKFFSKNENKIFQIRTIKIQEITQEEKLIQINIQNKKKLIILDDGIIKKEITSEINILSPLKIMKLMIILLNWIVF